MEVVEHFQVILDYEVIVDPETGDIQTKLINKSIDKAKFKSIDAPVKKKATKTKKEESNIPQLILEENKYSLNTVAVELMQVTTEDKIDIKYEKRGKNMIPVIGSDTVFGTRGGCKLTKSNTVACRGSKNDELAKYGTIFEIIPHESKQGLFILKGENNSDIQEENSEIKLDSEDENLPLDVDITDLVDDKDANLTEIDSNFFVL